MKKRKKKQQCSSKLAHLMDSGRLFLIAISLTPTRKDIILHGGMAEVKSLASKKSLIELWQHLNGVLCSVFPADHLQNLMASVLDHSPLLLHLEASEYRRFNKAFK